MARVLTFAPDFEDELAAYPRPHRRTPFAAAAERELAPCLLPLGDEGDWLLAPEDVPEAALSRLREAGLPFARPVTALPPAAAGAELVPWGASLSLLERGRALGLRCRPLEPAVVRRVNSKAWSHALERELGVSIPGARLARSVEEVRAAIVAGGAPLWVVKDPFGVAGRGRLLGRGATLDERGATWVERALAAHPTDPLLFEPWLDVEAEMGVQLEVLAGGGGARLLGVTASILDDAGHYVGSRIDVAPDPLEGEIVAAALLAGARLSAEGYEGPAGVDALVHRAEGRRVARPICEINARHTMGMVALRFRALLPPGGAGAWLLLPRRSAADRAEDLVARGGIGAYDSRTREGLLVASPAPAERSARPARGASGLAVFVACADREVALAAERRLLAR